jgi:hypothetical protein
MGQNLEVFRCLDSLIAILANDARVRAFLVKLLEGKTLPKSLYLSKGGRKRRPWGLVFGIF